REWAPPPPRSLPGGGDGARRPPAAGLPAVVRAHHPRTRHRAARGFRQRSSEPRGAWRHDDIEFKSRTATQLPDRHSGRNRPPIAIRARGALYSVCPIAVFTRATSSGEAEASLLASAWG